MVWTVIWSMGMVGAWLSVVVEAEGGGVCKVSDWPLLYQGNTWKEYMEWPCLEGWCCWGAENGRRGCTFCYHMTARVLRYNSPGFADCRRPSDWVNPNYRKPYRHFLIRRLHLNGSSEFPPPDIGNGTRPYVCAWIPHHRPALLADLAPVTNSIPTPPSIRRRSIPTIKRQSRKMTTAAEKLLEKGGAADEERAENKEGTDLAHLSPSMQRRALGALTAAKNRVESLRAQLNANSQLLLKDSEALLKLNLRKRLALGAVKPTTDATSTATNSAHFPFTPSTLFSFLSISLFAIVLC